MNTTFTSRELLSRSFRLACVAGLLLPIGIANGQAPTNVQRTNSVLDFALAEGGVLNGEVRDTAGTLLENIRVTVSSGGVQIATTQTNAQGQFSFGDLREGQHVLSAANRSISYRFWQSDAAPPGAETYAVIIIDREEVVYSQPTRGPVQQRPPLRRGLLRRVFARYPLLTTAALVGAGIGSGIAIGSSGSSTPASP
ncbi:MAG: carboxypeptidase-like regulatory domain-containing protein [Planctomycetota bacterium]